VFAVVCDEARKAVHSPNWSAALVPERPLCEFGVLPDVSDVVDVSPVVTFGECPGFWMFTPTCDTVLAIEDCTDEGREPVAAAATPPVSARPGKSAASALPVSNEPIMDFLLGAPAGTDPAAFNTATSEDTCWSRPASRAIFELKIVGGHARVTASQPIR
jgi:hypothetical protein